MLYEMSRFKTLDNFGPVTSVRLAYSPEYSSYEDIAGDQDR